MGQNKLEHTYLKNRDFYGPEFYAWVQHQFDTARNHLKNCGKPKDDYDRFLIDQAKFDCRLFGKML
jgi:hypothetical protein